MEWAPEGVERVLGAASPMAAEGAGVGRGRRASPSWMEARRGRAAAKAAAAAAQAADMLSEDSPGGRSGLGASCAEPAVGPPPPGMTCCCVCDCGCGWELWSSCCCWWWSRRCRSAARASTRFLEVRESATRAIAAPALSYTLHGASEALGRSRVAAAAEGKQEAAAAARRTAAAGLGSTWWGWGRWGRGR